MERPAGAAGKLLGRRACGAGPQDLGANPSPSSTSCSLLSIPGVSEGWTEAEHWASHGHAGLGFVSGQGPPETDFGAEICGQEVLGSTLRNTLGTSLRSRGQNLCCQCRGPGSIPGWETKLPHITYHSQELACQQLKKRSFVLQPRPGTAMLNR